MKIVSHSGNWKGYPLFPDIPDIPTDESLELTPLDRWKNSPPETEAAHLSSIVNSVAIANSKDAENPQRSKPYSRRRRSHRATSSVTASDSTGKPTQRRRRRRRDRSPISGDRAAKQSPKRPYQCTFCTDTFRSKHDWTRHEKSLHLLLERWSCAPFGPSYTDWVSSPRCVFCNIEHPSETHIRDHRFWECQKDHLLQHLRLIHGTDIGTPMPQVEGWRSEGTQINSRCGFCAETFTQWTDRNNHLAAHFREGRLMKEWKGCRGLDPAVALAVENAMPPYLIGAEATGIEPFSASSRCPKPDVGIDNQTTEDGNCPQQQADVQPTPFEQLTQHLICFLRERQAMAELVTDDAIQREARSFVYGDEDPWNQTAADNPDWLQLFKDGMGLDSSEIY
ncbi:hypothetical protein BO71DRAFT_451170 [Aspergillus ellipticus CBS 707.79]|uniref:C2H2-type domain-containing protein n=1 Tax=Aspergillus ellipticus CBS 707.79 TaxID=1448320 RepID=A0A319D6D7_9EURO|nr:hypothetical protein BO71DRAFT_451170 [Aspergillus ellipticus CBS 707.79]